MVYQSDQHLFLATLKRLLFVMALFAVTFSVTIEANAANLRKYAGIVVDAKTGKTLYSHAADSTRYPASVAKVMTLYIVFEELDAGRLKLSSQLKVSKHAAAAVPTKLYLKTGTTITVSDAIQALVTKSANDAARVIAENISGSESAFADRMTQTARALGMARTTYKNASGLPDSRQITTVRDQARLGMAIFQHFPQYFKYFKTSSFRYRGNTYGNHNSLLRTVKGVDGIKTGYINAAGFNLLTSARLNNRHVIVAGFGFNSSGERNSKVASLVNKYLPKAHRGDYWRQASIGRPSGGSIRTASNPLSIAIKGTPPARPALLADVSEPTQLTPPPVMALAEVETPQIAPPAAPETLTAQAETIKVASIEPATFSAPAPPSRPIDLLMGDSTKPLGVIKVAAPIELRQPLAPAPIQQAQPAQPERKSLSSLSPLDLFGNLINGGPSAQPIGLVPPAAVGDDFTSAIDPTQTASIDHWSVQLGAAQSAEEANSILANATQEYGALKDFRPTVQPITSNGQAYYRARIVGFTNETEAIQTCKALKNKDIQCLALPG